MVTAPTFTADIHMAGDIALAGQIIQRHAIDNGMCVTLLPQSFIYTGGREEGFRVGFINYPRFPEEPDAILAKAKVLADLLMRELGQRSYSIVTPIETIWFFARRVGAPPMKPTPTPINLQALVEALEVARDQIITMYRTWVVDDATAMPTEISLAGRAIAKIDAALSVPAAAVVGEPEPIGYCSEYGLDKLASQAHHYCLSVSKAQENEFQFPIYATRISQQDAELERMREALKPFALAATIFEQEYGDRMKSDTGCNIKFAVLCQARDALRAKAEETPHG